MANRTDANLGPTRTGAGEVFDVRVGLDTRLACTNSDSGGEYGVVATTFNEDPAQVVNGSRKEKMK